MSMTPDPASAARAALAQGDMAAVRHWAATLIDRDPAAADGPFLLGLAKAAGGQIGQAIADIERAIALDPRGEYRAQLARLLVMIRRDADAATVLAAIEPTPPDDALSRDTIGCVYARLGDHRAALPHFDAAVHLAPTIAEFRYNRAATLNFLGKTDAAEAELEALIAMAPDHARAHHLLSSLRSQTVARNHVDRLRGQITRAPAGRDRLLFGYALAKELEDLGDPHGAFAELAAANADHRRTLPYDIARDAAIFDAIEAHWAIDGLPVAGTVPGSDTPIFVIGMPRTGTTLVDRILSSHPDVESAGELQAMPLAIKAAAATRTRSVLDPETVAAAARVDPVAIGGDYLRRAAPHRRTNSARFVDKFPGNFHYVGPIAQALPGAKIVCLRRHPLDTVLSNFRNLFAVSSRYYDYSYDISDIAAYYIRFDRLISRWRALMPGRVLEIEYEALVADQAGETRRLLDHCGLAWSSRCLAFHDNAAPVSTPSATQVRRPIYRDSVARWRRHEAALAPARRLLEAAGIAVE
jgi:tetratricopeptide (TPR) repeat protein